MLAACLTHPPLRRKERRRQAGSRLGYLKRRVPDRPRSREQLTVEGAQLFDSSVYRSCHVDGIFGPDAMVPNNVLRRLGQSSIKLVGDNPRALEEAADSRPI